MVNKIETGPQKQRTESSVRPFACSIQCNTGSVIRESGPISIHHLILVIRLCVIDHDIQHKAKISSKSRQGIGFFDLCP